MLIRLTILSLLQMPSLLNLTDSLTFNCVFIIDYSAISKKVVGETRERRMSNGGCTTERNRGYAI